jgi:RNA polymerase sigma-70 factor (ECF subfamily)
MLASMRSEPQDGPGREAKSNDEAQAIDDAQLIDKARAGDRRAFEELVSLHLQQVWRIVWRVLRHREDTEDVVQEVFLSAHKALPGYRGEAQFSTWIHRIAVNKALNYKDLAAEKLRRASSTIEASGDEEAGGITEDRLPRDERNTMTPLRELEARELHARLADCMKKLPPAWRAVFALRVGESLSYEEIAARVETALGTVRSRLARARLALKECLEGGGAA